MLCSVRDVENHPVYQDLLNSCLLQCEDVKATVSKCWLSLQSIHRSRQTGIAYRDVAVLVENFKSIVHLWRQLKEKQQIQLSRERLEEIGVRQCSFSDCIPLWKELMDSLESEAHNSERFLIPGLCSKSAAASDVDEQKIEDFRCEVENILIKTMLWIQVQYDRQPDANAAEDEEETMADFSTIQSMLSKCFGFDRLLEITQCFDKSLGVLLKISETGWTENQERVDMSRTFVQIARLLAMMIKCVQPSGRVLLKNLSQLFRSFTEYHHKTCKLCYISMNLILGLVNEGFCTEPEGEAEEAGGDGEFEEEEGTGMDDGQGRKDVSDEIEHQDQINTGKQKKAADQEEQAEPNDKEDARGIEMEDDFEGRFEDIEKEGDQSESDSGHEGEERLDDQMGKVGKEGETVDERLWDEDQPKDSETQDASEAENEDGRDTSEYMEGRLDEKQEESEKEKNRKEDTIERGDPMEEEEERDNGDGDEMSEGEGPPHPGFTKPEEQEEELQISEDVKLDGEEGDDKDSLHSEAGSQEPESEEPPIQKFAETEEKEGKKEDSQADIDPEAGEENHDENLTDEQGSQMDMDDNDNGQPTESKDKKSEGDDSLSVSSESEMEIAPQERKGAEISEGDGVRGDPTMPSQETAVAGYQEGDVTHDKESTQQQSVDVPSRAEEVMENYDAAPECGPSALGTSGEGIDGALTSAQHAESNNASKEKPSHKESVNPLRSLGDALEEWKRHLNVTDAMHGMEERAEVMADVQHHQQSLEAMEYEFVLEGQENAATMQTLATATEEQMQQVLDVQNEKIRQEEEPEENIDATKTAELSGERLLRTAQPIPSMLLDKEPNCPVEETEGDQKSDDMSIADEDEDRCPEPVSAMESQVCYRDQTLPYGEREMEDHEDTRAEIDHHQVFGTDSVQDLSKAQEKWNRCQAATFALASELTEHLRLVLEPTLASRLAGDYRTGAGMHPLCLTQLISSLPSVTQARESI